MFYIQQVIQNDTLKVKLLDKSFFTKLSFKTKEEAIAHIKSILGKGFINKDDAYYTDEKEKYYVLDCAWHDIYNPCKQESGYIGGAIHDKVLEMHDTVKEKLSGKINCSCCKVINYKTMKYGLVLFLAPMIPTVQVLGFLMIVIAMSLRYV
ncbi:hypothetical protein N9043_00180 [bacterium]|nr:hypothetical protein [bacterium]